MMKKRRMAMAMMSRRRMMAMMAKMVSLHLMFERNKRLQLKG